MANKLDIIDRFKEKWDLNDSPNFATAEEIKHLENKLSASLPESYKYLTNKYGDIYSPDILGFISDKEIELFDVQSFFILNQVIEESKAHEEAGMPGGYIAFASDCMGNLFCFNLEECAIGAPEPAIWLFDHDFTEMKKISSSFIEWLNTYVDL